jgi:hypothetical protein
MRLRGSWNLMTERMNRIMINGRGDLIAPYQSW